jgi:hypothetical protein
MGAKRTRWYQFGRSLARINDGHDWTAQKDGVEDPQAPPLTPTHEGSAAGCDGAMVARSHVLVSGSTAVLSGTMTNETGCDVYFTGMPPYVNIFDTDGSAPILLGDFNSPPRDQPSVGDWVMHPGASVPYRSLPVTLRNPDPCWDGTDWSRSSQSSTLDITTFRDQGSLPTVQIFN